MADATLEDANPEKINPAREAPRSKRFRFKRVHEEEGDLDSDNNHHRRHRHRSHHHHHRSSKRQKTKAHDDPDASLWDDSVGNLPPETAFRESLFDAMGDDEGAAFWEGVYGQPIHTFPNTYQNQETGELEQMNDDEYAAFVRRKMWEKSWEGIEAAREEKRRERERERDKRRSRDEEPSERYQHQQNAKSDFAFDLEIEESLRRGDRRKEKKRWKALWTDYQRRWDELQGLYETWKRDPTNLQHLYLRNKIAWPVESGKRGDVDPAEIERFMKKCADAITELHDSTITLAALLKSERVRFHPDKIQQRYGFMDIDETTTRGVTAVFQVFDRMWNALREKQA